MPEMKLHVLAPPSQMPNTPITAVLSGELIIVHAFQNVLTYLYEMNGPHFGGDRIKAQ